jgi:hypothetical protein
MRVEGIGLEKNWNMTEGRNREGKIGNLSLVLFKEFNST